MRQVGRTWTLVSLVTFLAVPVVGALAADEHAAAKDTTVQGEVLDLACYVGHGAKGAGHAECAKSCLKGGQPMGLLAADGTVYVLMADHQNGAPYDQAKGFAGKTVEIKGEVATQGSMKGITVHAVAAK